MVDIPLVLKPFERVHPFGKKVAAWLLAGAFLCLLVLPQIALPFLLAALVVAVFFRNPKRITPKDANAIVAPADGIVVEISNKGGRTNVGIFLNLLDVHIIRMPVSCKVLAVKKKSGVYLSAASEEGAKKNASVSLELLAGKKYNLKLISGLIARKIECLARKGSNWKAGERIGLIYLGSRVDITIPAGVKVSVLKGQRMVGGETIIATTK